MHKEEARFRRYETMPATIASLLSFIFASEAMAIDKNLIEAAIKAPYETTNRVSCADIQSSVANTSAFAEAGTGLSVVSLKQANELFKLLSERSDIPYGYAEDGCYVRAHQAAKVLEASGIISGKILFEGTGKFEANSPSKPGKKIVWDSGFHVVTFILVRDAHGKIEPIVLDPTFFSHPVSVATVIGSITGSTAIDGNPKLKKIYFRNRFTYSDPGEDANSWTDGLQDFRESALAEFQRRAAEEKKAHASK